jgi:hypothetical protein
MNEDWGNTNKLIKSLNDFGKRALKAYDVYEKWDKIGFLETLPESIQAEVALSLEEMYNIMDLDDKSDKPIYNDSIKTTAFVALIAVCRKLSECVIKEGDVKDFINELDSFVKDMPVSTIHEISAHGVDIEAELLGMFIEYKVDSYGTEE